MKPIKLVAFLSVAVVLAAQTMLPAEAKEDKSYTVKFQHQFDDKASLREASDNEVAVKAKGATLIKYDHLLPQIDTAQSSDWPLNGRDLANSRYAALDQITTKNIRRLAVRWIQQILAGGSADFGPRHETIPVVVNGRMYVTDMRANVYALDARTGQRLWQFTLPGVSRISRVTNRGAVYGDGKVYTAAGGRLFALNATTGQPLESFGFGLGKPVVANAVQDRFPGLTATASIGYDSTIAPQYFDGMVFLTTNHSENHCPGGLVIAVDGNTGEIIWKFNTVPQDANDEGWEIAGPTWVGSARNGGGTWNTPAIDPELGLIYFAAGNPSPDLNGSVRKGINLFTNSMIALDVYTGELRWYFQQVHHDIWDYDSSAPVILFDTQVKGKPVKACAQANKNGYVFILNRETGEPINPIKEAAVPTATDVPGEEVWPTQPIPYTAAGKPMEPFVPIHPVDVPPALASQVAPFLTPFSVNRFTIIAPSLAGGALYSQPGFSPQTGLLYLPGIDRLNSVRAQRLGATLRPGQGSFAGDNNGVNRAERGTLTAYDPATGELVWQAQLSGQAQAGVLVTAGNLVFVGTGAGFLYGFDATTGEERFRFNTGNRVHAAPIAYQLNGEQFITVAAGDIILTFALLEP